MDRDFRTPQDVARATPDRVEQSLAKELRRGVDEKPFVLRLRFQYDGGRAAPMLYVGALNRSWRDYINANARATDMITGVCSSGRGSVGRQLLTLDVRGGRGANDGNLNELNRSTRRLNLEVVYCGSDGVGAKSEPETDGDLDAASAEAAGEVAVSEEVNASLKDSSSAQAAEGVADAQALGAEGNGSTPTHGSQTSDVPPAYMRGDIDLFAGDDDPPPMPQHATAEPATPEPDAAASVVEAFTPAEPGPTSEPAKPLPDLLEQAKTLKRQFEAFKATPTADGLETLTAAVQAWRDGLERVPEMRGTEAESFVSKLSTLLETKGKQFVAQHSG